jgi:hypothetical protein
MLPMGASVASCWADAEIEMTKKQNRKNRASMLAPE